MYNTLQPENTRCWSNVWLMLVQRRRRWTNIKPTLGQRLLFSGYLLVWGSLLWGASVTERRARPQTARARISNPVSGGQCHLTHLTILRKFSWPSLAYVHTSGLKSDSFTCMRIERAMYMSPSPIRSDRQTTRQLDEWRCVYVRLWLYSILQHTQNAHPVLVWGWSSVVYNSVVVNNKPTLDQNVAFA